MIGKKTSHRRLLWLTLFLLLVLLLLRTQSNFLAFPTPSPGDFAPPSAGLFNDVDAALEESVTGNIAYNTPDAMQLGDTVNIEVLLSPVQSGEELARQIGVPGELAFTELQVTDRMRATLQGADPDAFRIRPLQSDADQLVSTVEATSWRWSVEALEPGSQQLILIVERFVELDGEAYLRPVKSFQNTITIRVTAGQWVRRGGWMWLLAAVAVPAVGLVAFVMNRRRRRPLPDPLRFLNGNRYPEVREILLSCGPFGDEDELRAIYADPRIRPWRDQVADADSPLERVETTVHFLGSRTNKEGENGLVLLIHVLRDRLSQEDGCYVELDRLARELKEEVVT